MVRFLVLWLNNLFVVFGRLEAFNFRRSGLGLGS